MAILLDAAKCHSTELVNNKMNDLNAKKILIPPRMTNLLQPADVSWFKPLKQKYHHLWNEWFLAGNHTFTRNDNARSPGYAQAIGWLSTIWEQFESHIIINSFECCSIIGQFKLLKVLQHIVSTNSCISNYVDAMIPADSIDGFESDDDIFDEMENNEEHILSNSNITSFQQPQTIVESSTTQENIASMNYQMPINYPMPMNNQMPMNYQMPKLPCFIIEKSFQTGVCPK